MSKLETATHVFLIAVCCLAGGLLIEHRFFPPKDGAEFEPPRQLVGREVKLPGADWQAAPVTVLLQLSSTCRFCNESMPFYRQLLSARQSAAAKVPVIVVSADAVAVMQKHLSEQQLAPDRVLHSRLDGLSTSTPTVYIVDAKGMVRRIYIGKLNDEGEKQVLSIVQGGKV